MPFQEGCRNDRRRTSTRRRQIAAVAAAFADRAVLRERSRASVAAGRIHIATLAAAGPKVFALNLDLEQYRYHDLTYAAFSADYEPVETRCDGRMR